MNKQNNIRPPRRFRQLFECFCKHEFFEELQGDLEERFYDNAEKWGLKKANAIYRGEVFMMLRPSVIRGIHFPYITNQIPMLRNYSLVAFRNIGRYKLFSSINIIGLAVSMAVGLLVISFLTEMYTYDEFHEKKDQIYRLTNTQIIKAKTNSNYASTSPLMGRRLEEEFTGFEQIVYLNKGFWGDIVKDENTVEFKGLFASASFFEVFDFELIVGSPEKALKDPYTTVLTQETALKVFGKIDVLGEVIQLNGRNHYTVTGIAKTPPRKSHIRFDALGSFATLEAKYKDDKNFWSWNNMWSNYVYLTIPDKQSLERVQQGLNKIAEAENENNPYIPYDIEVSLQPMNDIFPGKRLNNQLGIRMNQSNIQSMIILALIVLFSACFNYTNLSIARALKRAKEIGIRRTIGAKGREIFIQFVLEAIIITLIALVIAFCIFLLIRPEFISLNRMYRLTTLLEVNAQVLIYFIMFGLIIGIFAGFIPAFIFSQLKTVNILQGSKGLQVKGIGLRKLLIGLQFTLSVGFAILVTLAYKQYQFALNFDLGFQTENILNISAQNSDIDKLANEISQLPEVQGISYSGYIPSVGMLSSAYGRNVITNDSNNVYHIYIDERYLDNLGHQLIAGQNFNPELKEQQMIVNEKFVKTFGFETPQHALGQQIEMYENTYQIAGVIEDFHYGTIDNPIESFTFLADETVYGVINTKLVSQDMSKTMEEIESIWTEIDPVHPLEATFYSEQIESAYTELSTTLKIFGLLAIVAVSISILGLLGLATYQVETRTKELAIRKVLGASVQSLMMMLSKSFMILFAMSIAIALPVSYYLFNTLIVPNAVYKIPIGFWELGTGIFIIMVMALFIIFSQTFKAAHSNPVNYLRNE